jgi:hypothetical protein
MSVLPKSGHDLFQDLLFAQKPIDSLIVGLVPLFYDLLYIMLTFLSHFFFGMSAEKF